MLCTRLKTNETADVIGVGLGTLWSYLHPTQTLSSELSGQLSGILADPHVSELIQVAADLASRNAILPVALRHNKDYVVFDEVAMDESHEPN